MVATSDHGVCHHCNADLNGDWIYEYFLEEYDGNEEKALDTASMYGATKTEGRFGRAIYVKEYYNNYTKSRNYWKCPDCGGHWW